MSSRARLVCTLGPSTPGGRRAQDRDDYVLGLVTSGMDVARINLSHAQGAATFREGRKPDYSAELAHVERVKAARTEVGKHCHVAVLLDLQGIKIRLYLPEKRRRTGMRFDANQTIRMRLTDSPRADEIACDASPRALEALRAVIAERGPVEVAIADGDPMLVCESVDGDEAVLTAPEAGTLRHRKGVTFRGVDLPDEPPLPERDRIDLAAFALPAFLRGDADFIALSFVRNADDVAALRDFSASAIAYFRDGIDTDDDADLELFRTLDERCPELRRQYATGETQLRICAKLETGSAMDAIDDILGAADAVMIARGDLGLQCHPEDVPHFQKDIIRRARLLGRPAVVATQMLGSMERAPEPTRAEASDVFNAVVDGADALMLSGETALGSRPHRAVATLQKISSAAEAWQNTRRFGRGMQLNFRSRDVAQIRAERGETEGWIEVTDRMTVEAVRIAEGLECEAIVAVTRSGETARNVARFDPLKPVIAIVPDERVARRLALTGAVRAIVVPADTSSQAASRAALAEGLRLAVEGGFLTAEARVLVVEARPDDPPGSTSQLEIMRC